MTFEPSRDQFRSTHMDDDEMAWVTPQFSRGKVDKAGASLIAGIQTVQDLDDYFAALEVISNWRSSHSFPLNTFQTTLRRKGRKIDPDALVAQRIKRLSSISLKLKRFPGLRLSQMQDIGGCRIVLKDVKSVQKMVDTYRKSDIKHALARVDDYLATPQPSGYRGIHMIYKYFSDKNNAFNDLKIEIQIRSQFQHAWATAVETVGTFLSQSLKSSLGEADWLRFFQLMGTAIAFAEGTAPVEGTPKNYAELVDELAQLSAELDVMNKLEVYGNALQFFQEQQAQGQFFLLTLDPLEQRVTVRAYTREQLPQAQAAYLEVEKLVSDTASDAVLVSVDSVAALQKAYPNYFLDTRVFIGLLRDTLEKKPLTVDKAKDIKPSARL